MKSHELKLYRGYANDREVVVQGHVFRKYPSSQNLYDREGFRYIKSVFQLFTVKTVPNARLIFRFNGQEVETRALFDGYFRFAVPLSEKLKSGWHPFSVTLDDQIDGQAVNIMKEDDLLVPSQGGYTIISDIDDTFLVSYSGNVLKKLYVMLTRNVEARKPFEGVVKHYQLLSLAGRKADGQEKNTFFYVSSSEWNLYEYINRFIIKQNLPKAVLKLKKIKTSLFDFFSTGGGSHQHKQNKIEHIVTFYPQHTFILLGDDSQRDPYIYENIVKIYPRNIRAIYIRRTEKQKKPEVMNVIDNIAGLGVSTCYFEHSSEAIEHSVREGIISEEALEAFGKERALSEVR
ncbi:App1 family protein [Persicitalea jodogahamensis]|uniref:Phosphatase n=1 Tax=Persicitalea jodogahamensis TaxID=402147 RepID=A0A8J3GB75_9BACT|nr:App1 family protein [Persicitalea jodogahamensis]GHB75657.1 phosphatase [Persicitalea jodogahamensis]